MNKYNQETKGLYMEQKVPTHIIAIDDGDEVIKCITHTQLQTFGHGCFLQGREVSKKEAYEYLNGTEDYIEEVSKILAKQDKKH